MFGPFRADALFSPVHIGEQMVGLHGGGYTQLLEFFEVLFSNDLRVFDAEAEIGAPALFLGECESVQGHSRSAVADGVKADLEPGFGPFGGHLVESFLLVARQA